MTLDLATDKPLAQILKERTVQTANGPVVVGPNSPLLKRRAIVTPARPQSPDAIDPAGRMKNKLERQRAIELEAKRRAGEIRRVAIRSDRADPCRSHSVPS